MDNSKILNISNGLIVERNGRTVGACGSRERTCRVLLMSNCLSSVWGQLVSSSVLLGGSNPAIVEHIFMVTKWYIWKSKCKGKMCEQRGLMNSIRVVYEMK